MREIKFRAYQDDKMYYAKSSGVYATKKFLNTLYEDCELMQFTGLQDKNGKDIYEGDISGAKLQIEQEDYHFTCSVIFENCKFTSDNADFELWIYDELEIIGNIHENNELLNQNK